MGIGFYPHLAWDSIRKNKRLYLPYILTCTGMVMMFYIIAFLAGDTMLKKKPPKANWFIALCGVVILGGAYYIAVTIENPLTALSMFFVAVIMVIIGTYLLFIAGSVTLCRILQKNKHYYYKTSHFVSVSSMLYRMKRNGAGLASICVLCTMVLVMLSSTVCLYAGEESVIRNRYPKDIDVTVTFDDYQSMDNYMEKMKESAADSVSRTGGVLEDIVDYSAAIFGAMLDGGRIVGGEENYSSLNLGQSVQTYMIFAISVEDYNRLMEDKLELADDEAAVCFTKGMGSSKINSFDELVVGDGGSHYKVKKVIDKFISNGTEALNVLPTMYIFVNNPSDIAVNMMPIKNSRGSSIVSIEWFYQFDMTGDEAKKLVAVNEINAMFGQEYSDDEGLLTGISNIQVEGRAAERENFYTMFGALLFLAIFLGIVFVLATVLIIYYKQVAEGYEDSGRFEIMKKLGMTRKDIKSSINSQMLTVFFLPIAAACVHLAFAFPIVNKLLMCFGFYDKSFFALVNVVCVLVFTVFYVIVYRITSKSYYNIVNE